MSLCVIDISLDSCSNCPFFSSPFLVPFARFLFPSFSFVYIFFRFSFSAVTLVCPSLTFRPIELTIMKRWRAVVQGAMTTNVIAAIHPFYLLCSTSDITGVTRWQPLLCDASRKWRAQDSGCVLRASARHHRRRLDKEVVALGYTKRLIRYGTIRRRTLRTSAALSGWGAFHAFSGQ